MQHRIRLKLPKELPFDCHIAVRITDLNYGNHVGNEKMLEYLQEARIQFFAVMGYSEISFGDYGLIMADAAIQYRKELKYPALLQVQIGVVELSQGSFTLCYRVWQEAHDSINHLLIAEATTTLVSFNYQAGKPSPLSNEALEKLRLYSA